jgi:hypothetical protein
MPGSSIPEMDPLLKAATEAVANAVNTKFPLDGLLGPELSRLISVCASVVKRHGLLLERAIIDALEKSERFQVLHNPVVPITAAADSLVASNPPETLARVALRYDAPTVRSVTHDLVVIDTHCAWAGAYQVKRGGGDMGPRLRRPLERDLAATRLLLRSYLRDLGYTSIDIVTTGAIDWLGSAGLPEHLSIAGTELDAHFGVPVTPTIERMTAHLRAELHKAVPDLLRPLLSVLEMQVGATAQRAPSPAEQDTSEELIDPPDFLVNGVIDFPTRPIGPGPRRAPPETLVVPRPPDRPSTRPLF